MGGDALLNSLPPRRRNDLRYCLIVFRRDDFAKKRCGDLKTLYPTSLEFNKSFDKVAFFCRQHWAKRTRRLLAAGDGHQYSFPSAFPSIAALPL